MVAAVSEACGFGRLALGSQGVQVSALIKEIKPVKDILAGMVSREDYRVVRTLSLKGG